jgi:hypothetical protein
MSARIAKIDHQDTTLPRILRMSANEEENDGAKTGGAAALGCVLIFSSPIRGQRTAMMREKS